MKNSIQIMPGNNLSLYIEEANLVDDDYFQEDYTIQRLGNDTQFLLFQSKCDLLAFRDWLNTLEIADEN
jgi:hypothetical protein